MLKNQNITILYVDDEEPNLILFERVFEEMYEVITAESGEKGLEVLKKSSNEITAVLSDMKMPRMNGVEFIKIAKKSFPYISYFILTAFDYNREIDLAIKENIIDKFFTKPFDEEVIGAAIDTIANARINGN